jgi:hypothetical protein
MLKKSINAFLTAALVAGVVMGAANPAAEAKDAPKAAQTKQVKEKAANALPYKYESKAFGYTIQCPQEPAGVIPANVLYEDKQGEVLIFEHEGYDIKYAWLVLTNAFTDKAVPNLNTISDAEAGTLLKGIMGSNGYEGIMLVPVNPYNKGIYAVTAKVVEIDTDGDGQPDTTAEANSQMAVTFFRGADGERYAVELLETPELNDAHLDLYRKALATFKTRKG